MTGGTHNSVLNRDRIAELCRSSPPLIDGADAHPDKVKHWPGASYDLRLGRWARVGKVWHDLNTRDQTLRIPPHEVAYVETDESLNLPNDLVATFGLRMKWLFHGLIIPPQTPIDPGYRGKIFILMFNLSDADIHIGHGEHIISMEFRRVDPVAPYAGPRQGEMSLLAALKGVPPVESGLAAVATQVRVWRARMEQVILYMLAITTFLLTVLAVMPALQGLGLIPRRNQWATSLALLNQVPLTHLRPRCHRLSHRPQTP